MFKQIYNKNNNNNNKSNKYYIININFNYYKPEPYNKLKKL